MYILTTYLQKLSKQGVLLKVLSSEKTVNSKDLSMFSHFVHKYVLRLGY